MSIVFAALKQFPLTCKYVGRQYQNVLDDNDCLKLSKICFIIKMTLCVAFGWIINTVHI